MRKMTELQAWKAVCDDFSNPVKCCQLQGCGIWLSRSRYQGMCGVIENLNITEETRSKMRRRIHCVSYLYNCDLEGAKQVASQLAQRARKEDNQSERQT